MPNVTGRIGDNKAISGIALIAVASIIFGLISIFNRLINLSPIVLSFYRFVIASGFMLVVILAQRTKIRVHRGDWPWFIVIAIGYIINSSLFVIAVRLLSVSDASFLFYLFPVLVVMFAPIIKEKVPKLTIIALIVGLLGAYLMTGETGLDGSNLNWAGAGYALSAAVSFAVVTIASRKVAPHYPGQVSTLIQCALSSLILLPVIPFIPHHVSPHNLLLLVLFGIGVWGVGITLMFQGLRTVTASKTSILMYLDPLSASIYAIFFFHEIPSLATILGGVLIVIAGYLVSTSDTSPLV